MKITRTSLLSGETRDREIDVTPEQLIAWHVHGVHIQDAMPNLTAEEREFLMTGITKEEWDAEFGEDDSSECIE